MIGVMAIIFFQRSQARIDVQKQKKEDKSTCLLRTAEYIMSPINVVSMEPDTFPSTLLQLYTDDQTQKIVRQEKKQKRSSWCMDVTQELRWGSSCATCISGCNQLSGDWLGAVIAWTNVDSMLLAAIPAQIHRVLFISSINTPYWWCWLW